MLSILVLSLLVAVNGLDPRELKPLSDEMIDYINNVSGASWTAGRSSKFRSEGELRAHIGSRLEPEHLRNSRRPTVSHDVDNTQLPKSFDARVKWPECDQIKKIRDQSSCGSCWAVSAVSVMSDRICIQSQGTINPELSARDLLSCCPDCGDCDGGSHGPAWDHWKTNGIVTGGSMEENTGCLPYPFPACDHFVPPTGGPYPPCKETMYPTPACLNTCQSSYGIPFAEDKIFGKSSYNIQKNESHIRQEIMMHGPVESAFLFFADFGNYKSGIYHHVAGEVLGGHSVRILGWGEENGLPYWLIANTWNERWGEEGLFRMRRGRNECGIEQFAIAGQAELV